MSTAPVDIFGEPCVGHLSPVGMFVFSIICSLQERGCQQISLNENGQAQRYVGPMTVVTGSSYGDTTHFSGIKKNVWKWKRNKNIEMSYELTIAK